MVDALIDNQQDIARWIAEQTQPLRIAVAFWGADAIYHLGLAAAPKGTKILLDLSAGASNPEEVERLIALFPNRVLTSHRLHAKAWIGADDMIVGSANASANGLGAEGSESLHWRELGVRVSNKAVLGNAIAWFDNLWNDGRVIHEADLDLARRAWQRRRRDRPFARAAESLLEAAIVRPEDFEGRNIYVVVSSEEMSDASSNRLEKLSEIAGKQLYAFEDWPDIPIDATLICFDSVDGKITLDQDAPICSTTEHSAKRGKLRFVFMESSIQGLPLGSTSTWIQRIKAFAKNNPKEWNKGDMSVELLEFLKKSES